MRVRRKPRLMRTRQFALLALALLLNGSPSVAWPDAHTYTLAPLAKGTSGSLRLLTYNVAGLPEVISDSHPERDLPLIGARLSGYDVVLTQEDFAYPRLLGSHVHTMMPLSTAQRGFPFGDGLTRFAAHPMAHVHREAWKACHGTVGAAFDCWAAKGFSVVRHTLAHGTELDIYDLHMDAGKSRGDRAARARQVEQLIASIAKRSGHRAIIVAGDFNMDEQDEALASRLMRATGLRNACTELQCTEPHRIDRVFYRSDEQLDLEATRYSIPIGRFSDVDGPLSDHDPVSVEFAWRRN